MTETTENTDGISAVGELYFDGTCQFCVRWINRVRSILTRRGIRLVPFADGGRESEMRLRWHDGREFGGADAVVFLSARIWWAWPLRLAAAFPGVRPLLHRIYRRVAANRHCRNGACSLEIHSTSPATSDGNAHFLKRAFPRLGWIILILLTGLAFLAGKVTPIEPGWAGDLSLLNHEPPGWLRMWMLAGALWIGFKLIAWLRIGAWRALGFRTFPFAAWVGMDAGSFLEKKEPDTIPIAGALARTTAGAILVWAILPAIEPPIPRGWLGMAGILLILHFGLFEIAAAALNRIGFHVRPIMDAPWRARTLGEFWGDRWNRAFSDVARVSLFRPLVRRLGVPAGTLAGFAFSGLTHELVISVPANGGYGLPTVYFMIQGLAVLAERKFGLRGTTAGRAFLWLAILAPAFWLFHPAFMTTVIDPFLHFLELTNH